MKIIGIIALAGLTACTTTYDRFSYEVTEVSAKEVRIQTHKGALGMVPSEVDKMFAHMQNLATAECRKFGKSGATYDRARNYTTGVYYAWHERIYSCV